VFFEQVIEAFKTQPSLDRLVVQETRPSGQVKNPPTDRQEASGSAVK